MEARRADAILRNNRFGCSLFVRMRLYRFKRELMETVWHPARVARFWGSAEVWGAIL